MAAFQYDPNKLGRNFASYNAFGDINQKNADLYRGFVTSNPDTFESLGGEKGYDQYIKELTQKTLWNPETNGEFKFSQGSQDFGNALEQALQGYSRSRTGYAGLKDGRINLLKDSTGNVVSNSSPYSYNPAKETLSDVMKGIALQLAVAGGASAFGGSGLGNVAALPGDFGAVEAGAGGLGGTGAAGGGSLIDSAFGDLAMGSGSLAPEGVGSLIPGGEGLATLGGGSLLTGGGLGGGGLSSLGNASSVANLIKKTIPGKSSGGSSSGGGLNYGNLASGLAQLWAGNQYRNSLDSLYSKLESQFGPNSAYADTLRKELSRRDAASGRRSQYGPREVELQAKLADAAQRNTATMAGLIDKDYQGLNSMLQAGIGLGKDTGLTDLFGGAIKNVGNDIWSQFQDSQFYKDLFGDWGG